MISDVELGTKKVQKKQKASSSPVVLLTLLTLVLGLCAGMALLGKYYHDEKEELERLKTAVGETSDAPPPDTTPYLEIAGEYNDNYDSDLTFTADAVTTVYAPSSFDPNPQPHHINITFFHNELKFLVGKNSGPGTWYPDKWSRIDWMVIDDGEHKGKFAICSTLYNAETEEKAMRFTTQGGDVPTSILNASAFLTNGCNGFPFSILTHA